MAVETSEPEQIAARENKRSQRKRGRPTNQERIAEITEECKAYPLNRIKRAHVPGLTSLQRAILNAHFLPVEGISTLPASRIAEIVEARLGHCDRESVGRFRTSAKCQKAMSLISEEWDKEQPMIDMTLRDMALGRDIRAIRLIKELNGKLQVNRHITFNQYNIGDDRATGGFLDAVKGIKALTEHTGGTGQSDQPGGTVEAEFEVVDRGSDDDS